MPKRDIYVVVYEEQYIEDGYWLGGAYTTEEEARAAAEAQEDPCCEFMSSIIPAVEKITLHES